jgi:hypothetical protein
LLPSILLAACTTMYVTEESLRDGGTGGAVSHPTAAEEILCQPCEAHTDCGGRGNYCLRDYRGHTFCGVACVNDETCPAGFGCWTVSGHGIEAGQCLPQSGDCATAPPVGCDPPCASNEICQDHQCVPATAPGCDPPCPFGQTCQNDQCVPATPTGCDPPCPYGQTCQNDQCVPAAPAGCDPPCPSGQTCQNDQCVPVSPPSGEPQQHCVDVINQYRATIGRPPLARSAALDQCASQGAQADSQSGWPHGHFSQTNGCNGVAWAENEIPGWPGGPSGVMQVIDEGLQMMWEEGPGGGHYENMSGDSTQVGCGVFVTGSGDVWVVQDFK